MECKLIIMPVQPKLWQPHFLSFVPFSFFFSLPFSSIHASFSIILFSSVCPCLAYVHSLLSVFHSLTISLFISLSLSSVCLSPSFSFSSFSLSPYISSFSLSLPIFLLFLSLPISLLFLSFSPLSLPFLHPLATATCHTSPHFISFLSFLCFVFLSRDHHGMSYTPGYAGKWSRSWRSAA